MSYQLAHWVWPATLIAVCALAVWRGGPEERLGIGSIVLGWALTLVVFKENSEETQWQVLLIDCFVFGIFVYLALKTRRYWPIAVAALKLLGLVTHVAHAFDTRVSGWAYQTLGMIWSYLSLFTIAYASWTAPRHAEPAAAGDTRR